MAGADLLAVGVGVSRLSRMAEASGTSMKRTRPYETPKEAVKMTTRRSTGKIEVARSLWYAKKGVVEIRNSQLPPLAPDPMPPERGMVQVRAAFSGVSRGTERLILNGLVPAGRGRADACPLAGGHVSIPGQIRLLRDWDRRSGASRARRARGNFASTRTRTFFSSRSEWPCRCRTDCRCGGRRSRPTWKRR